MNHIELVQSQGMGALGNILASILVIFVDIFLFWANQSISRLISTHEKSITIKKSHYVLGALGIVLHEASHVLVGTVVGFKHGSTEFHKFRQADGGYIYGSTSWDDAPLSSRLFFVGIAPAILLPLVIWLLFYMAGATFNFYNASNASTHGILTYLLQALTELPRSYARIFISNPLLTVLVTLLSISVSYQLQLSNRDIFSFLQPGWIEIMKHKFWLLVAILIGLATNVWGLIFTTQYLALFMNVAVLAITRLTYREDSSSKVTNLNHTTMTGDVGNWTSSNRRNVN